MISDSPIVCWIESAHDSITKSDQVDLAYDFQYLAGLVDILEAGANSGSISWDEYRYARRLALESIAALDKEVNQ